MKKILPKCPLHPPRLLPGWASFCPVCGHFVNCEDGRGLPVLEWEDEGAGCGEKDKNGNASASGDALA